MSLLSKMVAGAEPGQRGENIRDGIYLFMVENLIENQSTESLSFVAELRVVESQELVPGVKPNPVGSTVSYVQNTTKHPKMAFGNIKTFVQRLLGLSSHEEVTAEIVTDAVSAAQPWRGAFIRCRTKQVVNQGRENPANRGNMMTLPTWETVDQDHDTIAENRAKLDASRPARTMEKATEPAPTAAAAPKPSAKGLLAGRK